MDLKRPLEETDDTPVRPSKKIMLFGVTIEAPVPSSAQTDQQAFTQNEVLDENSLSFTKQEWSNAVSELAKYRVDGIISVSDTDNIAKFYERKIRAMFEKGLLHENQFNQMDDLGFVWKERPPTPKKTSSKRSKELRELKQFVEENGHCILSKDQRKLSTWLSNLRVAQRLGKLEPELERTLEDIGVIFDYESLKMFGKNWHDMYQLLKDYHDTHGSFSIPKSQDYQLHVWANTMKRLGELRSNCKLSELRLKKLQQIGFLPIVKIKEEISEAPVSPSGSNFNPSSFESKFEELVKYKEKTGHCIVPTSNSNLYNACAFWRSHYKKGTIPAEKKEKLLALGFPFSATELKLYGTHWQQIVEELKQFRDKNGHFDVPKDLDKLHTWLKTIKFWVENGRHDYAKMQKAFEEIGLRFEK